MAVSVASAWRLISSLSFTWHNRNVPSANPATNNYSFNFLLLVMVFAHVKNGSIQLFFQLYDYYIPGKFGSVRWIFHIRFPMRQICLYGWQCNHQRERITVSNGISVADEVLWHLFHKHHVCVSAAGFVTWHFTQCITVPDLNDNLVPRAGNTDTDCLLSQTLLPYKRTLATLRADAL